MDFEGTVSAIRAAIAAEREEGTDENKPEQLIAIKPFKAIDEEDNPIEVIGVGYFNQILQFLVIAEEGDELYPIMREQVFRVPDPATTS